MIKIAKIGCTLGLSLLLLGGCSKKASFEESMAMLHAGKTQKAMESLHVLADEDDVRALNALGDLLFSGKVGRRDYLLSAKYYLKALSQNSAHAGFRLASMYHHALGTPLNLAKAATLYGLAAKQGYLPAQNALAWLLATCPVEHVCDGKRAMALAMHVVSKDKKLDPEHLDTLAASFARVGKFKLAIKVQKDALNKLNKQDKRVTVFNQHLKLYQGKNPLTVQPPPGMAQRKNK